MAFVGLEYPVCAPIDQENESAEPTYKPGLVVGRAMSADVSYDRSDEEMYADNVLAESDNSILGGTVTLGVDRLLPEAKVMILDMVKAQDGTITEYGDASPYVGFGYIRNLRYKGKPIITAYWIYKVQFGPSNESASTKQRNTQFSGESVEGNMMPIVVDATEKPAVRKHKEFETVAAAKAWLNGLAGITAAGDSSGS